MAGSTSPLEQELLGTLESPNDCRREPGAVGAVRDAVVEREGDRQQPARHDPAIPYDRLLARARDAEDGHLGVVDDRDRAGSAERAEIGDGEGPSAQVLERGLARANALRERRQLALQLDEGLLVDVADDRNDQAALGRHRHAEMAVALDDQLARRRVETGVECRVLPERERGRLQEKARQRQDEAALALRE